MLSTVEQRWPFRSVLSWWERLRASRWRGVVVWVSGVTTVVLLRIFRTLEASLHTLHRPGGESFGMASLGRGSTTARRAIDAWRMGGNTLRPFNVVPGRSIAAAHATIDLVLFVPAYVTLLGVVLAALHREHEAHAGTDNVGSGRQELLRFSLVGLVLVAFVHQLANVAQLVVLTLPKHGLWFFSPAVGVLAAVKTVLLALVIVPLVLAVISLCRTAWHPIQTLREGPAVLRILLIAEAAFVLLLNWGEISVQSDVAIRRWLNKSDWLWLQGPITVVVVSLAVLAGGVIGARLARVAEEVPAGDGKALSVGWLIVVGTVVGGAGFAVSRVWHVAGGVAAIGAVVLVIGLLSAPIIDVRPRRAPVEEATQQRALTLGRLAPRVLAIVPALAVGAVCIRVAAIELVAREPSRGIVALGYGMCFLAAIAPGGWMLTGRLVGRAGMRWPFRTMWIGALASAVVTTVLTVVQPISFPRRVGILALTVGFLAIVLVGLGTLGAVVDRYRAAPAFAVLGLRLNPIATLLVLCLALGGIFDKQSDFHDARLLAKDPAKQSSITLEERLDAWYGQAPRNGTTQIPLVLVTASGGGIRAAAWTASVLDCLFAPRAPVAGNRTCGSVPAVDASVTAQQQAWRSVFAAGGASGGSVGLAAISAEQLSYAQAAQLSTVSWADDWIENRLGADHLAPSAAWMFNVEGLSLLPRLHWPADRAEELERSFEAQWSVPLTCAGNRTAFAAPFLALSTGACDATAWVPLLLFNGTAVADGCRVNVTALDAAQPPHRSGPNLQRHCDDPRVAEGAGSSTLADAASYDLVDLLCPNHDLRLSTAAFLSARFPFVSPAARLPVESCGSEKIKGKTVHVVDGGYRENSGASQIDELWPPLETWLRKRNANPGAPCSATAPCVKPIVVAIENGYSGGDTPRAVSNGFELLRPLNAALAVFGAETSRAAQSLALHVASYNASLTQSCGPAVACQQAGGEVVRFSLVSHPGVTAPLGWTLADTNVKEFRHQLEVCPNAAALGTLRARLGITATKEDVC